MTTVGTAILAFLTSVVAALIGWLAARDKNKADIAKVQAEAEQIELSNVEKAIEIWRSVASDLRKEVTDLKSEITSLRMENKHLKQEIQKLEKAIQSI